MKPSIFLLWFENSRLCREFKKALAVSKKANSTLPTILLIAVIKQHRWLPMKRAGLW